MKYIKRFFDAIDKDHEGEEREELDENEIAGFSKILTKEEFRKLVAIFGDDVNDLDIDKYDIHFRCHRLSK